MIVRSLLLAFHFGLSGVDRLCGAPRVECLSCRGCGGRRWYCGSTTRQQLPRPRDPREYFTIPRANSCRVRYRWARCVSFIATSTTGSSVAQQDQRFVVGLTDYPFRSRTRSSATSLIAARAIGSYRPNASGSQPGCTASGWPVSPSVKPLCRAAATTLASKRPCG